MGHILIYPMATLIAKWPYYGGDHKTRFVYMLYIMWPTGETGSLSCTKCMLYLEPDIFELGKLRRETIIAPESDITVVTVHTIFIDPSPQHPCVLHMSVI